ncbi:hypothetical protein [Pantoea sp. R13S299]|uniref:hypothetical protein n=1 Tax=Pantoea sp. R13S299 TaxID=3402751 RepID=UPI003ADD9A66
MPPDHPFYGHRSICVAVVNAGHRINLSEEYDVADFALYPRPFALSVTTYFWPQQKAD